MENLENELNELEVYHDSGDGTGFHLVEQDPEQEKEREEREEEGVDLKSALAGAGVLTLVSLVVGGTVMGIKKLKKGHDEKRLEKARKLVAEADAALKKEQEPEPDFMNEPEEEESNETPEEE